MNPEHADTNAAIARLKHEGLKWEKIGRLLGLSSEVCRDRYRRRKQRALTAAPATGNDASPVEHVGESRVEPIPAAVPRVASVLELPPRPFEVPLSPGVFDIRNGRSIGLWSILRRMCVELSRCSR